MLHHWYDKLGYNIVGEVDYKKLHPEEAARANYHMVLVKYQKHLLTFPAPLDSNDLEMAYRENLKAENPGRIL